MMRSASFCTAVLLFATLGCSHASAQKPSPAPASAIPAATPGSTASSGQTAEYTLPPDKLAKAKALYDIRGRLRIIGAFWGFVVLLAILYLGVVSQFRNWAERASNNTFVQALIVVPLFLIVLNVVDWPLAAYEHSISLQYGLSVQHWGAKTGA